MHTASYQLQCPCEGARTPHTSPVLLQMDGRSCQEEGTTREIRKGKEQTRDKQRKEMTYRFLSLVSLGSIDGIVIFCNMQM